LSIKNYQNTALAGIEEREWAKSKALHVYTERLQGGINPTVYGLNSPKEFRLIWHSTLPLQSKAGIKGAPSGHS
jgi:hypothetical protein